MTLNYTPVCKRIMGSETWVLVHFIIIRILELRKLKGTILLPPRTQLFTSQQAIDIALQSFGATRFSEAQGILLKVLDAEPEHSFANQLLGIIAYQLGDWKNAMDGKSYPSKGNTVIGNDVWIGYDVTIMPGVKIGDGAIIGSKSVVTKDVAPYSIVGGNPAKEIRKRFTDEQINYLLDLQWWNWPVDEISAKLELLTNPPA